MRKEFIWKVGTDLNRLEQNAVLAKFVHRFTGDNQPNWAKHTRMDGTAYPLQFATDGEWLANTLFRCNQDGMLDDRAPFCESTPTWPNNPELRAQHKEPPFVSGTVPETRGNRVNNTPYGGCP